jgi:hypothetical protein
MSTLDERIAAGLSGDATSSDLAALIAEVETAKIEAEEAVTAARSRSLDPLLVDTTAARTELADVEFRRDRLQVALPRLKARHLETHKAEQYAVWRASFDAITAKQAALAQELEQRYRPFEDEIVGLLLRIEQADNEAVGVHCSKPTDINGQPYADGCDLRKTETVARSGGGLSVVQDLKLPAWKGNTVTAWPPWRPELALQVAAMYAALPVPPCTPEQFAARDALRQQEAARVAAFYGERQQEREERKAAEARAAQERDIERRRQAGWG